MYTSFVLGTVQTSNSRSYFKNTKNIKSSTHNIIVETRVQCVSVTLALGVGRGAETGRSLELNDQITDFSESMSEKIITVEWKHIKSISGTYRHIPK